MKSSISRFCSASAAALLLLSGCGGGGGGGSTRVQSIAVTPRSPSITVGNTEQFMATATYSDGHTADISSSATWSSAMMSVGTVTTAGLATGAGRGTSVITASMDGASGDSTLFVSALQGISINPSQGLLDTGATFQFIANGAYDDTTYQHTENISSAVTWSSSVPSVATVSSTGLVTAVDGGITTIKATLGSFTVTSNLTIRPPNGWSFDVGHPRPGAFVDKIVHVTAQIGGPVEIQSVSASIGGLTIPLTFEQLETFCTSGIHAESPCWVGDMNISGLARGSYVLTVTAKDVQGNNVSFSEPVVHDPLPEVTMTAPTGPVASQGQVAVTATCTDDAGACTSLVAIICRSDNICSAPLATGAASLNTTVSVRDYDGSRPTFRVVGTDSDGQTSYVEVPLSVDTSTHYTSAAVVPGDILDADAGRILYTAGTAVFIRDRSTQADTQIFSGTSAAASGSLTPAGAVFVVDSGATSFESGMPYDLGTLTGGLVAKGSYVLWNNNQDLYRRDVSAHTQITISTTAYTTAQNNANDVASNGTVAYFTNVSPGTGSVRMYKPDGTDVLISSNGAFPRTDGTNVVYSGTSGVTLNDGSSELVLVPATQGPATFTGRDYQIAAGWVAYRKPGPSGVLQIWRRDLAGQQSQFTFASTDSLLDRLADNGSTTFFAGGRRSLVTAAATTTVDIGSDLGMMIFINGVPHVAIANTLFLVQ